jgi:hypothetical protein
MKYLNMVPLDEYGGNAEWRSEVMKRHEKRRAKRRSQAVVA